MNVRDKLREAEYFLGKMRETSAQEVFKFNLSAFLSAARSVPDYLLEDYNIKYSLQIPLTEKLYSDTFEDRAKQTGNLVALSFIQWWKHKIDALNLDPIWSLLTNKRHINVHRDLVRPDRAEVKIQETIRASESLRIEKYDKDGKLTEIYESPKEEQPPKPIESEVSVNWFFSEYDKEPIISVCEKYLDMMKKFVEEAEQKFP